MPLPQAQRVVCAGLIARGDRVLVLRRSSKEIFLPGFFDLPGGKVDLGEAPDNAVVREVFEECGLRGKVRAIYGTWHWVSNYRDVPTHFVSIGYVIYVAPEDVPQAGPGFDQHQWVTEDELSDLRVTPELRADLARGFAWLKVRGSMSAKSS